MAYDERRTALEIARLLEQVRRLQAENERLQALDRVANKTATLYERLLHLA